MKKKYVHKYSIYDNEEYSVTDLEKIVSNLSSYVERHAFRLQVAISFLVAVAIVGYFLLK